LIFALSSRRIIKMRVDVYSAAEKWDYVIEVAGTLAPPVIAGAIVQAG